MANRGQAQYLRIYSGATTYYRWQNWYVGTSITWDSATWTYQPFVANGMIGGTPGTNVGVTIDLPATDLVVNLVDDAIDNNYLCELKLYEFDTLLGSAAPQTDQDLIGTFVGEVIGASGTFSLITLSLGSSLAPTGAQAPPRKFTSLLVGAPIRM
tara:strand:- start:1812 stop:2276 length:465 start_codon:yes stop_codon:yes gene_type:complete